MRGRVYSPELRRFLTPDPLVSHPLFGQSYNRYSYVLNRPLNFVDPSGYLTQVPTKTIGYDPSLCEGVANCMPAPIGMPEQPAPHVEQGGGPSIILPGSSDEVAYRDPIVDGFDPGGRGAEKDDGWSAAGKFVDGALGRAEKHIGDTAKTMALNALTGGAYSTYQLAAFGKRLWDTANAKGVGAALELVNPATGLQGWGEQVVRHAVDEDYGALGEDAVDVAAATIAVAGAAELAAGEIAAGEVAASAEVAGGEAVVGEGVATGGVDKVGSLPKPPRGPSSMPKAQRDPKRVWTPSERAVKRQAQGGECATGCGTKIDASNSRGHHIERHADGGRTNSANHAEVCVDCHLKLHSP